MSPAVAAVPDAEFVEVAVPLLKEYAEKLAKLTDEANLVQRHLLNRIEVTNRPPPRISQDELARRWKHLKAPAKELARQASGVVEEGRLTDIDKVQLWLRLAEFEHYLTTAEEAVGRLAAIK